MPPDPVTASAEVASGPPGWAALGADVLGSALLGGLLGGSPDQPGQVRATTGTTSNYLGNLPPELSGADIQQLLQAMGLSGRLGTELMNMPGGLSYANLASSVLTPGLMGGIDLANLPQQIGQNVNEAFTSSLSQGSDWLNQQLGTLSDQARRQASAATESIMGGLGAMGLRGSTAGGMQLANTLGGIQSGLQSSIQGAEQAAGQYATNAAMQRAQGLTSAYGLQGQLAGTLGNLLLNQRGQQIGLRGAMESNRMALLADPVFQNLFNMRQATGGQAADQRYEYQGEEQGGFLNPATPPTHYTSQYG